MNDEQLKLLTELYSVHSPTGDEWALICLIRKYVEELQPEVGIWMDRLGNLYFTNGTSSEGCTRWSPFAMPLIRYTNISPHRYMSETERKVAAFYGGETF